MDNKSKSATEENIRLHYGKIIKWMIVGWVISLLLTVAICEGIATYERLQYDYSGTTTESKTITVDGKDGTANYINNNGDYFNGEGNSKTNNYKDANTPQKER